MSEEIYKTAYSYLGKDASPEDHAPDGLACAETVSYIIWKATGKPLGQAPIVSTLTLRQLLLSDPRFKQRATPIPGAIVVSATGLGNGKMPHGHAGICGKTHIMSNSSETGKLEANYTYQAWENLYRGFGGFPIEYFECV